MIATAGIPEALAHVTAKLAAAGLPASHTIGDVTLPGAWVHVTRYQPTTLGGAATLTVAVDLLAEAHDEQTALRQLDQMLAQALTVIVPTGLIETDNAIELSEDYSLPSFRIPTTITYTKD